MKDFVINPAFKPIYKEILDPWNKEDDDLPCAELVSSLAIAARAIDADQLVNFICGFFKSIADAYHNSNDKSDAYNQLMDYFEEEAMDEMFKLLDDFGHDRAVAPVMKGF